MKVELLYFSECQNAEAARALLARCMIRLGIPVSIDEREGDFPSPSILVNGMDVMGADIGGCRTCRLDRPTEDKILVALRNAAGKVD